MPFAAYSASSSPERTWIVVPCYNEADRFDADAFAVALERLPSVSFVLVDDGSTDGTREVLAAQASLRLDDRFALVARFGPGISDSDLILGFQAMYFF